MNFEIEFYSICISGAKGVPRGLSEGLGDLGVQGSYGNSRFVGNCVHLDLRSMEEGEMCI